MHAVIDELKRRRARADIDERWPELAPPTTETVIQAVEAKLGFRLPDLLRTIYLEVGNGGIGNTGTIEGITAEQIGGAWALDDFYLALRQSDPKNSLWIWPEGLVPFCHWPAGLYSCADCTASGAPVFVYDADHVVNTCPWPPTILPHMNTLNAWFFAWLDEHTMFDELVTIERPPFPPNAYWVSEQDESEHF